MLAGGRDRNVKSNARRNIAQTKPRRSNYDDDRELVKAVLSGSVEAWHSFIDRYSGLIFGVLRRLLFAEDEDEIRTVYVDILQDLYDRNLEKYEGRASLSTWLIVLARARASDFLRKRYGRYRPPKGLQKLSDVDQQVLRLYYVERMSLEIVVHTLKWNGHAVCAEDIVTSIERIESVVDQKYLKRLDNEHHARAANLDSVGMLKYLIHLNFEYEKRANQNSPDAVLMEEEAGEIAERVRALVAGLATEERKIVDLRFKRGLSARRVSEMLGLSGQRYVYTVVDRVVRGLRVLLNGQKNL